MAKMVFQDLTAKKDLLVSPDHLDFQAHLVLAGGLDHRERGEIKAPAVHQARRETQVPRGQPDHPVERGNPGSQAYQETTESRETEALQDRRGPGDQRDRQECPACLGRLGSRVPRESQVSGGRAEREETPAWTGATATPEARDHQVKTEREGQREMSADPDPVVQVESVAPPDHQEHLVSREDGELPAQMAAPASQDLWDQEARRESPAALGCVVALDYQVHKVPREAEVMAAPRETTETLAHEDLMAAPEATALQGAQETEEVRVDLAHLAPVEEMGKTEMTADLGLRERLDYRGLLDRLAHPAEMEIWEYLEQMERTEEEERQAPREMLVPVDPADRLDPQDTQELLDQLEHRVLLEGLEIRESVDWRGRRERRESRAGLDSPDDQDLQDQMALLARRETRASLELRV